MERMKLPACSQEGSAMLMALMVFLVLSIMGTAIISVAAMESKIALNDARTEQARQAADAGVQVARNIIMNYLGAGESVPVIPEIDLGNGRSAQVDIDTALLNSGIVTITSIGTVKDAAGNVVTKKTAEAELLINGLPYSTLQADELKAMGKYYTGMEWLPQTWEWVVGNKDWKTLWLPLHGPIHPGTANPHGNLNPNHYTWWTDIGKGDSGWPKVKKYNIAPFFLAQGKVDVVDASDNAAEISINNWVTTMEPGDEAELFYERDVTAEAIDTLGILSKVDVYQPDRILNSKDFIGKHILVSDPLLPEFNSEQLDIYRNIAQLDPEWQYIPSDSHLLYSTSTPHHYRLLVDELDKTRLFIDLPAGNIVEVDFTTITHHNGVITGWNLLDDFINDLKNQTGTFLNLVNNSLGGVVLVSPASLKVGYDSVRMDMEESSYSIFLVSGENIEIFVDPKMFNNLERFLPDDGSKRFVRTFILAGGNIDIVSTPKNITFSGIISTPNRISVMIDYFDRNSIGRIEKNVTIREDKNILAEFPEPWAYIGMGAIISYKYVD